MLAAEWSFPIALRQKFSLFKSLLSSILSLPLALTSRPRWRVILSWRHVLDMIGFYHLLYSATLKVQGSGSRLKDGKSGGQTKFWPLILGPQALAVLVKLSDILKLYHPLSEREAC